MTAVFPQRPYFDDYDENKKFMSALFVPGRPLQAREQNFIQSALQKQIERLGDHFFKDGAKIIDGDLAFDTEIYYVKMASTNRGFANLVGSTLTGGTSGSKAVVIAVSEPEGDDPATMFVRFVTSDTATNSTYWVPGETIAEYSDLVISDAYDSIGNGSVAEITRGIYYVDGYFAVVDPQTIILDKYSNVPSYRVGLQINTSIVTPEQDESLLDNAIGSYNYAAPGAHRYKIELILTKIPLAQKVDNDNFIELGQIQAGKIVKQTTRTEYSELEETLARRTYDESGDYTVRPFKLAVREHRSNDRGTWHAGTTYLVGDIVKNHGITYIARTEGRSEVGNGPQWTTGSGIDGAITWEVVSNPKFNNGVFPAEGKVTGINIIDGGNGYVSAPDVLITSNSGTGASATAVVSDGKVISIRVDNGGSGYLYGDVNVQLIGGLTDTGQICYDVNGTETQNIPVVATATASTDAGDVNKLAIGLEAGKAYVRGYEIEKQGTSWLSVDKARTLATTNNVFLTPQVGNYFRVTNIKGAPPLSGNNADIVGIVDIYDRRIEDDQNPKGNKIGTARIRGLEWDSGERHNGSLGVYRLYVYDVKLNAGISLANRVKAFYSNTGSAKFSCNVDCNLIQLTGSVSSDGSGAVIGSGTSFKTEVTDGDYIFANDNYVYVEKVGGQQNITTDSNAKYENVIGYLCTASLYEPQGIAAFYQLPNQCVYTLDADEIDYTTMDYFTNCVQTDMGTYLLLSFSTSSSDAVFANPDETDNLILFDNTTGEIVQFTANNTGVTSNSVQLNVDASLRGHQFTLIGTVRHSGVGIGRCTKTSTKFITTLTNKNDVQTQNVYLGKADAYRLIQVKMYSGAPFDESIADQDNAVYTDITNRYELVSGQTDSYYGESYLRLKSGYSVPSAPISVEFNYFEHGATGDYYTVDSYDVSYDEIPSYNGISLRDVIDFRPTIISGYSPSKLNIVKRGTEIETSYQYYLGRKDKITLDYTGQFNNVQGVPATNPQLPETPNMSMNLYNLTISPYTFGTSATDVVVQTIDNKRYTMRDIGKLEQRINVLEQYTALSLLEQQTESMEITDSEGLTRYKQGFVVDNFQSPLLVNDSDPDACCSIDIENSLCRPSFTNRNVTMYEFIPTGGQANNIRTANNYKLYGKVFTLPLDIVNPHVAVVEQPQASRIINVNPYAVATFIGSLTINPSSDDWYETEYLPDVVTQVEGNYLSTKSSLEGTVWNSWQTAWTGATTTTSTSNTVKQAWGQHIQNGNIFQSSGYLTTIKTTSSRQVGQTRTGVKTTVTATTDYELVNDRLVSTSIIPYMRSRWLLIRAKGLMPYTRYYPYFDNVAVDYWCVPCSRIDYTYRGTDFDATSAAGADSSTSARQIVSTKYSFWPEETDRTCLDVGDVITGRTSGLTAVVVGKSRGPLHNDPNTIGDILYVTNIKTRDGAGVPGQQYNSDGTLISGSGTTFSVGETIDATNSISGASGEVLYAEPNKNHTYDPLVTNSAGELYFMFWIPDGDKIDYAQSENVTPVFQFRCGDRVFALSSSNESNNGDAEGTYSATGILNTRQKDINAVRNAVITRTTVTDNRTITETNTTTSYKFQPVDPLAQTFNVPITGGCFLSKVDIYFASKPGTDNPLPIRLQIRTCENGIPTQNVLPFGEVSLRPDQVNVSDQTVQYIDEDGNTITAAMYDVPTTFEFESPVYIDEMHEYAVVLLSDSNDYNVWVAAVGDVVPGQTSVISKQPHTGVLLKSQNASTWTPDQTQDLKFTVYRANFMVADSNTHNTIVGNVQFCAQEPMYDDLDENCFETIAGSGLVRVLHDFHGLQPGMNTDIRRNDINEIDSSVLLTGNITTSTTTKTVMGTGTRFVYELSPRDVLYVNKDGEYVEAGVVASIDSDVQLTLTEQAEVSVTDSTYTTEQQSTTVNGIPYNVIAGNHQVIQSDLTSYIIDVTNSGYTAQETGYSGGKYWQAKPIYNYDVIQPNITTQSFSETGLAFSVQGVSGTSAGSTNQQSTGTLAVVANENNELTAPLAVWNTANRSSTSGPSLILNVQMVSNNPCLTPLIDGDRVSCIMINNVINNPTEQSINNQTLDRLTISSTNNFGYYGSVQSVEISNMGANYQSATVTFSEPTGITPQNGGVTATGTCTINNGRITEIVITDPGIGYIAPPVVTINGTALASTSVTQAVATASLLVNQIITTNDITSFDNADIGKYLDITLGGNVSSTTMIIDKQTTDQICCLYTNNVFEPTAQVEEGYGLQLRTRYVDEIAPRGGSVYCKYITKPITLSGTSTMIRVMFAASVPNQAAVDVYYKSYINGGSDQYDDVIWTLMEQSNTINTGSTAETDQFVDYEYTAENVPAFDVVAVKIVFRGTSSSQIAKVRDFRVLATV